MLDSKLTTPPPDLDSPRSQSPMPMPTAVYTTEMPAFYDQKMLRYPCKPPHDYSDEEFDHLNHFDFLHALNFTEPPMLPPYLNSNLLNDSNNKNYKGVSFTGNGGNGINEMYRYRINDLNLMDKYSTMKPARPVLKRSGSSNSSSSSIRSSKNIRTATISNSNRKLKVKKVDKSQVPHHVMLNHLITSNMNRDGYITSSSITRYKGRFITNIVYFSTDNL